MALVRPKKHLGQHFLKDENIALKVATSLSKKAYNKVLEIGAGTGALTKFLLQDPSIDIYVVEVDKESVDFLEKNFPALAGRIFQEDFLQLALEDKFPKDEPVAIIGNFPYNISSQILFKVYEQRDRIPEVVGMFQKEVAERIASPPGSKKYGILSVLLQAFYHIEYLFTVSENVFSPPPKVKSGVLRMTRNEVKKLDCDEELFFILVKAAFNQRRKTLKNALRKLLVHKNVCVNSGHALLSQRAEQLSVADFADLTRWIKQP